MFEFAVVVLLLLVYGYQFYRGNRRHEPSAADTISNQIVQSNARLPDQDVLEYQDRDNNSTRIRIDRLQETVTFENCHRPNRFWSIRNSKGVVCRFSDIVEVRGGLTQGRGAIYMYSIRTTQGQGVITCRRNPADYAMLEPVLDALAILAERSPHQTTMAQHPAFLNAIAWIVALLAIYLITMAT